MLLLGIHLLLVLLLTVLVQLLMMLGVLERGLLGKVLLGVLRDGLLTLACRLLDSARAIPAIIDVSRLLQRVHWARCQREVLLSGRLRREGFATEQL